MQICITSTRAHMGLLPPWCIIKHRMVHYTPHYASYIVHHVPGHHIPTHPLTSPDTSLHTQTPPPFHRYAILYWTPLIIYELLGDSFDDRQRAWVVALLTGIPFSIAAGATMVVGKHSKKTGELQRHVWIPMTVAGVALFGLSCVLTTLPLLAFVLLVPSTLLWSNEGVFMSWPRTFLHGAAAATGVALINSVGNCGGMVGPYVLGMSGGWYIFVVNWCIYCSQNMHLRIHVHLSPQGWVVLSRAC